MEETNKYLSQIDPRFLEGKKEKPASKPYVPPTEAQIQGNKYLSQINPEFFQQKEGVGKGIARTGLQPVLGAAKRYTWPANVFKSLADITGENILSEMASEDPLLQGEGREVAERGRQDVLKYLPTQESIEELIEEKTGAPLRPKNKGQQLLRLGGEAAAFRPGSAAAKGTAAVTAPAVSGGLQLAGAPDPLADIVGLVASGIAPTPSISKATKPSGMPIRNYESLKKDAKVSKGRSDAIKEKVEGDFRKIADQLLEKNRTYSTMKNDNMFKEKVSGLFDKVEDLASNVKGKVHSQDVKDAFRKRYNNREIKGITPDEFERSFRKEVRSIQKSIPFDDLNGTKLVDQFRKNNSALSELYQPGKSAATNRAKKEALLEYNRAIEDVINKNFEETEFKDLFTFTNKRWSEINDVEQINQFVDDVTKGQINYGKAKELFRRDKQHVARPFKRVLGDEGFDKFKTLTEDLLSTEKSMGYIKGAKEAGFDDLAKTASLYLVSPKLGVTRTLTKAGKGLYQMILDKPKLLVTWESAMGNLKDGNYKEAEKSFKELNKAIVSLQTSPKENQ